jgi:ribosomal protein S24E
MKTNPLIGRREVTFEIRESSTPRRIEVRRELATLLKSDLGQVWVKRMGTKTGTNLTVGLAHIYNDESRAHEVEPEHTLRRNTVQESSTEENN